MPETSARRDSSRVFNIAALILILLGLVGIQLLVRDQFADARMLRDQASRSVAARAQLAELLELHLDVESGVRGYILTEEQRFLTHYRDAPARRTRIFAELQRYGGPATLAALPALRKMSDGKLEDGGASVADVAAGNVAAAQQRVASERGRIRMDAIRAEIARMDASEADALSRLENASEAKRRDVERFVALLLVGIAVLLIGASMLLARATKERRAALAAARNVGEQEKAMFDGAVDGMLLLDARGTIIRANASVERMFGYTAPELSGRSNMFLMAEPFSEEQSLAWLTTVGRAGVAGAGRRQEFTGRRADGSTFETEVAISRFGDAQDVRFVAAIRDISHRKRAERMKSEFVSTVSHELRTPLTSIGGSLALLAGGAVGQLNDKASRLVDIAHNNCERLIRLINDLLDIEKIESGKMSFDLRKLNLGALIQRTVSANRQFAHDHGVTLEIGLPPWSQSVSGDPDRLEQVLTNLVSNAIKYSPPDETVYVTTIQRDGIVRVEVRDRGAGVPQEFRERIFSKFAMADTSDTRTRGGTGLGLAIVREIANRHGGRAGFEDRDGGGSTFFFELPLLQEELPDPGAEQGELPLVLHVDDDLDCLSVVASAFAGRAALVSASSMLEARTILACNQRIAGCIVDVGMGSENGLDLLPELRSTAPGLPVVLFTAIDDPHPVAEADAVLVKSRTSIASLVETTMALIARTEKEAR